MKEVQDDLKEDVNLMKRKMLVSLPRAIYRLILVHPFGESKLKDKNVKMRFLKEDIGKKIVNNSELEKKLDELFKDSVPETELSLIAVCEGIQLLENQNLMN